ncbi:alpha/beta fold hydrolase [Roseovarius rhodophyticola]|uniref:Alpha/beta fold hydrolase n=1 Tax=Roseovarius rhodophyticola TaxID=3080827 RepID=A0ABZ2TE91_9RHOB|nr:alpha/beta fold hydrolase [Roseovarius sp. W115]MDV2928231.1 alpha/beta fold hydrolase [Roseovarius sp. W115]
MDYFFSVRGRSGDGYSNSLGGAKYLAIPGDVTRAIRSHEISRTAFFRAVQDKAGATDTDKGNIVFFVHGFNTDQWDMLERHRKIRDGLMAHGFKGCVVSFDWPSDGFVLGYNADRRDARLSADRLFKDGITHVARAQEPDCRFNIHVLAHSMGCFLVREAFDFADDDHATAQQSWTVSQIAFVAADITSKSMAEGNPKSSSLLRRSTRLTNYYSPFDEVLSISETKRIGVSRRLGRVGLPDDHSQKAVNLYCGHYFDTHRAEFGTSAGISHRWYFEAPRFYEDLFHTFEGKLDRNVIPTRAMTDHWNLALVSDGPAPDPTPRPDPIPDHNR